MIDLRSFDSSPLARLGSRRASCSASTSTTCARSWGRPPTMLGLTKRAAPFATSAREDRSSSAGMATAKHSSSTVSARTPTCASACTFDTASCVGPRCGYNTAETPEVCDGTNLSGEDFDTGACIKACDANCGDGVCCGSLGEDTCTGDYSESCGDGCC